MGARRRRAETGPAVAPIRVPEDVPVEQFVDLITDPGRDFPVVATTARSRLSGPFVDASGLARALGEDAPVYTLTAQAAGALSHLLPARLDVYGGATRVWTRWPGAGAVVDEQRHPLFLTYSEDEAPETVVKVTRFVQELALAWCAQPVRVVHQVRPRPARRPALPAGVTPAVMQPRHARQPIAPAPDTAVPVDASPAVSSDPAPDDQPTGGARSGLVERSELDTAQELIASLQTELAAAKAEASSLRVRFTTSQATMSGLKAQVVSAQEHAAAMEQLANTTKNDLAAATRQIRSLEAQTERLERVLHGRDVYPSDPERQFRHEVTLSWLHSTTEQDRVERPLPSEWVIGPDFLGSVDDLDGVSRDKIVRVVTEVLTGLVWEVQGRNAHQQRVSDHGGAPLQVRDDGATAWRCALQVNSASARRLMWWSLPNGQIELGRVAVHDDLALQ